MKVAVPSDGPDLDARVGDRLGVSPYLLIIDLDSRAIEAHPNPGVSGSGAGMRMVALIISKKADFLLTRWCSPIAERHLSAYGVGIVTGMEGRVRGALEKFEKGGLKMQEEAPARGALTALNIDRRAVEQAVKSAFKQMSRLLPVVVGVIFVVGFFSAFLTQEMIASFFSGALWGDSLAGAFIGSLFAGNPVTSYIIGERLLELSVSSVAVTAFLCSWVTVGLIQLPAEIASLGWKFAIIRNLLCFVLSIGAAILMTSLLKIINI